jgi:hypothetical protein
VTELATVEHAQAHFAKRGVRFDNETLVLPDDFQEHEMYMLLSWLKFFAKFYQFYMADCLRWIADKYSEEAMYQFTDTLDYSRGTIHNILNVAQKVPRENVMEGLSFRHYAAVAPLSPHVQREILKRAAPEQKGDVPRMSSEAVREEVQVRRNQQYAQKRGRTIAAVPQPNEPDKPRATYEQTACPHCGQPMWERVN